MRVPKTPLEDYSEESLQALFYGNDEFEGLIPWLERVAAMDGKASIREQIDTLSEESEPVLSVTVRGSMFMLGQWTFWV